VHISRLLRGHPVGWALVSTLLLGAGYVDLWRGGTDVASTLLVLGYLVVVPLAIRRWDTCAAPLPPTPTHSDDAPPYGVALCVLLAVLLLYVLTLAPTTAMWDTSEYIATARVLGIPHPPGNPMFVLIAHTFALLPFPVTYAERVNLLAATTSAMSAGLWCLVAHRMLRGWQLGAPCRTIGAALAAIIGATCFTVWNQSVVNEKVYTVAMLGVAIVSWLSLRWVDSRAESRRSDMLFAMVAYVCALGYANHPAGVLPAPAVVLLMLGYRLSVLRRWRLLLVTSALFTVGVSPFAFEPIRSAHQPPINEGNPTACVDGPTLSCTFSETTWQRLLANIQREQYGGHPVLERQAPYSAELGMWWEYYGWQWWRDPEGTHALLQQALSVLFGVLGLAGAVLHWRRDRASFTYVAALVATVTPALIFYLNFKYSPGQLPELGDSVPREVRDRDYFFVWSFATWSLWIGLGVTGAWQWIARRTHSWVIASPILLVAIVPLVGNASAASRHGQTFTREWARDLLRSVEPYAILITNGDNDSFPLWYAQQVEGFRRDVTVALVPYLGTDWYPHQLRRWRVAAYAHDGLPAYDSLTTPTPTQSPFALSDAALDSVPPYLELREPRQFVHHRIVATVRPGIVTRDQLLTLQMITDAFPSRPIYFSLGGYAQALGLGDYVVAQGLAQRLLDTPASEHPAYTRIPGGFIDVARTRALWATYGGMNAVLAQGRWMDESSISIPYAYRVTGQLLSYGLAQRGDSAATRAVMEKVANISTVLRLGATGGASR